MNSWRKVSWQDEFGANSREVKHLCGTLSALQLLLIITALCGQEALNSKFGIGVCFTGASVYEISGVDQCLKFEVRA